VDRTVDRDPEGAFERLHAARAGALEALVIADTRGVAGGARARRLFDGLVGGPVDARDVAAGRRRWLVSIGLLARAGRRHRITPLGRQVLGAHAAEVYEIRKRIEDLFEDEREADADRAFVMEAILEVEEAPGPRLRAGVGGARVEGPLDLPAGLVRAYSAGLELPEGVIERAAAALSAGKHLILAGPPGTGDPVPSDPCEEVPGLTTANRRSEGLAPGAWGRSSAPARKAIESTTSVLDTGRMRKSCSRRNSWKMARWAAGRASTCGRSAVRYASTISTVTACSGSAVL